MTLNLSIFIPDDSPHATAKLTEAINEIYHAGGTVDYNALAVPQDRKAVHPVEVYSPNETPLAGFRAPEGT